MTLIEAQQLIRSASDYFLHNREGYQSWGEVKFVQIAVRIDNRQLLISDPEKKLSEQTPEDLRIIPLKGDSYFQKILFWSPACNIALKTKQEFASQIQDTIPPVLDDQAQLLGINVKISKNPSDAVLKTIGRYATILKDGYSICIGKNLEDAFTASQLLEKTSKTWVLGKYLGGAKSINIFEAWIMHLFYQLKYSKQADKNI